VAAAVVATAVVVALSAVLAVALEAAFCSNRVAAANVMIGGIEEVVTWKLFMFMIFFCKFTSPG
jgi:hypothetical protein